MYVHELTWCVVMWNDSGESIDHKGCQSVTWIQMKMYVCKYICNTFPLCHFIFYALTFMDVYVWISLYVTTNAVLYNWSPICLLWLIQRRCWTVELRMVLFSQIPKLKSYFHESSSLFISAKWVCLNLCYFSPCCCIKQPPLGNIWDGMTVSEVQWQVREDDSCPKIESDKFV